MSISERDRDALNVIKNSSQGDTRNPHINHALWSKDMAISSVKLIKQGGY